LSSKSAIAVKIFNMDQIDDTPIASTVMDLFDNLGKLRQGTWNCKLYENTLPDYQLKTCTPGLPYNDTQCTELNNMLRMI